MHTRLPWVLAALALGAVTWLLSAEVPDGTAASFGAEVGAGPPAAALTLEAAAQGRPNERASGPRLASSAAATERAGWRLATVRVVSPKGEARVGIPIRIECAHTEAPAQRVLTGPKGVVELGLIPLDGSVSVKAFDRLTSPGEHPKALVVGHVDILLQETLLTCDAGLRLDVSLVDAESGEPVSAECEIVEGIERPTLRDGRWGARVALLPGEQQVTGITFPKRKIQSLVSWGSCRFYPDVSRYAHRLEMVYPMRRHGRVIVRAEEADGSPTERAEILAIETAGRNELFPWRAVPHRGGWLVRGVPFFRDEPISMDAPA